MPRNYLTVNLVGLPHFLGVWCYVFEGVGSTLEIYDSVKNRRTDYLRALGIGIGFTAVLYQVVGSLVYFAFA
ncbi:MAG: hypothetical protein ACK56I_25955 [bacterium]